MIHLRNVSKRYRTNRGDRRVLFPVSLSIPTDGAVAVLGRNGAGKSTLLRMLAGVEGPDSGEIVRTVNVSWPIGYSGGLHAALTGRQNTKLVCRILGLDERTVVDYVADFSELGAYIDVPVNTYSSGMRARLAFGLSLAIDFDCYLIDEAISTGDRWFRDKCRLAFEERRRRTGLIFVSHEAQKVRQYCDSAIVIHEGLLLPFETLAEAEQFYSNV